MTYDGSSPDVFIFYPIFLCVSVARYHRVSVRSLDLAIWSVNVPVSYKHFFKIYLNAHFFCVLFFLFPLLSFALLFKQVPMMNSHILQFK